MRNSFAFSTTSNEEDCNYVNELLTTGKVKSRANFLHEATTLYRLANDPAYLEQEMKRLKEEYDKQVEKLRQVEGVLVGVKLDTRPVRKAAYKMIHLSIGDIQKGPNPEKRAHYDEEEMDEFLENILKEREIKYQASVVNGIPFEYELDEEQRERLTEWSFRFGISRTEVIELAYELLRSDFGNSLTKERGQ